MSENPVLPITADFSPLDQDHRKGEVAELVRDVESMGVRVHGIHFQTPDGPPRLYIQFTSDEPQWEVRARLEAKLYDVGSKLGKNELSFYVTRRVEETKGWAT